MQINWCGCTHYECKAKHSPGRCFHDLGVPHRHTLEHSTGRHPSVCLEHALPFEAGSRSSLPAPPCPPRSLTLPVPRHTQPGAWRAAWKIPWENPCLMRSWPCRHRELIGSPAEPCVHVPTCSEPPCPTPALTPAAPSQGGCAHSRQR